MYIGIELTRYKDFSESNTESQLDETLTPEHDMLFESRKEKILLNISSIILLVVLAFLWIWYR